MYVCMYVVGSGCTLLHNALILQPAARVQSCINVGMCMYMRVCCLLDVCNWNTNMSYLPQQVDYAHTYVPMSMHAWCMHVFMFVYMCVSYLGTQGEVRRWCRSSLYIRVYKYIYIYTHTCMHARIGTHTKHTHTYHTGETGGGRKVVYIICILASEDGRSALTVTFSTLSMNSRPSGPMMEPMFWCMHVSVSNIYKYISGFMESVHEQQTFKTDGEANILMYATNPSYFDFITLNQVYRVGWLNRRPVTPQVYRLGWLNQPAKAWMLIPVANPCIRE